MERTFSADILRRKTPLNYPYFLLFFACVASMASVLFFSLDLPPYFLFYSLGQACLETTICILLSALFKAFAPGPLYFFAVSILFIRLLVHFTNFMMLRLMDVNLSYLLDYFAGHGIGHVVQVFQAINMNEGMLFLIAFAILAVPILGFLFYQGINILSKKRPFSISIFDSLIFVSCVGLFLLLFESMFFSSLKPATHEKYQKTLPFRATFFSPIIPKLKLAAPISSFQNPQKSIDLFKEHAFGVKPNIYLFIIETFRKDFLTEEIAPHLNLFAKENIDFPKSFANANQTPHSWLAIFHSIFPFHWTEFRQKWREGSAFLQILKNGGYKIRAYSASDLRYFGMDEMIFGPNRKLADSIDEYALDRTIEPWQRDAKLFDAFERDLQIGETGNVFLFFIDSTHSEYSFPEEFASTFTPIVKQIDYVTLDPKNLESVKNRYRNAICYVDSLMHRFFEHLKGKNLFESAIIAITGDHGEEFFEEGALFHGTHLNHVQTSVPLLFKCQNNAMPVYTDVASHIDIVPSLLHSLCGQNHDRYFDGQSIFSKNRQSGRIAVLAKGAKPPSEFVVEKGNVLIRARFLNPDDLYKQNEIEVLSASSPYEPDTLDRLIRQTISKEDLLQTGD